MKCNVFLLPHPGGSKVSDVSDRGKVWENLCSVYFFFCISRKSHRFPQWFHFFSSYVNCIVKYLRKDFGVQERLIASPFYKRKWKELHRACLGKPIPVPPNHCFLFYQLLRCHVFLSKTLSEMFVFLQHDCFMSHSFMGILNNFHASSLVCLPAFLPFLYLFWNLYCTEKSQKCLPLQNRLLNFGQISCKLSM